MSDAIRIIHKGSPINSSNPLPISITNISALDTRYLKLDCSNDPLTGTLRTSSTIEYLTQYEYDKTESW
jgi:hypothetical protein